jgi:tripeptide aminopeptidase
MKPIAERFMRYVKIDTQSDPHSLTFPSTEKQKDLSRVLVQELLDMGIADAHLDEFGYVYATVPSNSDKNIPVVCFCSHVDTAPDCTGTNVKPILHENFQGDDIVLPDDTTQIISISEHPYLKKKLGDDIITASGLTLLGADDKSGVAIIMELASYLQKNNQIKHGDIKILFTPDEEVGRGVDHVDIKKLGADVAYTLDGGELGALESENFSADRVIITINGVSAHPGYGKDKLVNAIKIAGEFLDALPKSSLSPETTDGKDGFFHPVEISGNAEKTILHFIVRDFSEELLHQHEAHLKEILVKIMSNHSKASFAFEVKEQYRNMKEVLDLHPKIIELAATAIKDCGLPLHSIPVRGGTDGSRLSFMGLPCPNIFTGEMAFHSKQEYVSVQDMEKATEVLIALVQRWEQSV